MLVVTGGAGFIGSAFLWGLNKVGRDDIVVVDEFDSSIKWKNLVKRRFDLVLQKEELLPWLEKNGSKNQIEAIVHMGACSSTTQMDMGYLLSTNSSYSMALFRYCADLDIPFIYASSAATYGLGEQGYADKRSLIPSLLPINPYGYSKQLMDTWAIRQKKVPTHWYGLKFFNVFGPNEYHKGDMQSLVAKAYPQIEKRGTLRLFKSHHKDYADGEQKRDFIYIKDVVRIMLHFLLAKTTPSGIYNVGTGIARTFADLGKGVFSALGLEPKFEWIDMPQELRAQYQYFTQADIDNLRQVAKFAEPFTKMEEAIHDYVTNYLCKEDPYL